jgi:hypothetical protein
MTYNAGDRVVLNDTADLVGSVGSPNALLRANRDAVGTVIGVVPDHPTHLFVKFDGVESNDPFGALIGMPGSFAIEAHEVDPYTSVDVSEFEKEF